MLTSRYSVSDDSCYWKDVDYAVAEVSATMYHLQHIRSALLYHRNTSPALSINKLPSEILSEIFTHVSWTDPAIMFAISHTCARWRQVALHTPEMWSGVELVTWEHLKQKNGLAFRNQTLHPELTALILHRSGNTDMFIYHFPDEGRLPVSYHAASLSMIQQCLNRLVELDVTIHSNFLREQWVQVFSAPKLRRLAIYSRQDTYRPDMVPMLFGADMPQLESLHIVGFRLPWKGDLFPRTLKELQIDEEFDLWGNYYYDIGHFDDDMVPPSANLTHPRYAHDVSVASVLQHCPQLEDLTILRCSNLRAGPPNITQPASLPKLHSVTLQNAIDDCAHILNSIRFLQPPNLDLSFQCMTDPDRLNDRSPPRLFHLPDTVLDYISMCPSIAIGTTYLRASYRGMQHMGPEKWANIRINMQIPEHGRNGAFFIVDMDNLPRDLTSHVDLSRLRYFKVVNTYASSRRFLIASDYIVDLLRCMPALQHLALTAFSEQTEDPLFNTIMATSLGSNPPGALFPNLRSVEVQGCHFFGYGFVRFCCIRRHMPKLRYFRAQDITFEEFSPRVEGLIRERVPFVAWDNVRGIGEPDEEWLEQTGVLS